MVPRNKGSVAMSYKILGRSTERIGLLLCQPWERRELLGETKICEDDMSIECEKDVFRLQVPVWWHENEGVSLKLQPAAERKLGRHHPLPIDDSLTMQFFNAQNNFCCIK